MLSGALTYVRATDTRLQSLDDDERYVVVSGCGAGEIGEGGLDFVAHARG